MGGGAVKSHLPRCARQGVESNSAHCGGKFTGYFHHRHLSIAFAGRAISLECNMDGNVRFGFCPKKVDARLIVIRCGNGCQYCFIVVRSVILEGLPSNCPGNVSYSGRSRAENCQTDPLSRQHVSISVCDRISPKRNLATTGTRRTGVTAGGRMAVGGRTPGGRMRF